MSLQTVTQQALTLTQELLTALSENQSGTWLELLDKRGQCLSDFEDFHRQATDSERQACQSDIQELSRLDQELKTNADSIFNEAKYQLSATVGTTPNYSGTYNESPTIACVDRKA